MSVKWNSLNAFTTKTLKLYFIMSDIRDEYGKKEITQAFMEIYNIDAGMLNEMKIESIFESFNRFTLEKFETFLKQL